MVSLALNCEVTSAKLGHQKRVQRNSVAQLSSNHAEHLDVVSHLHIQGSQIKAFGSVWIVFSGTSPLKVEPACPEIIDNAYLTHCA